MFPLLELPGLALQCVFKQMDLKTVDDIASLSKLANDIVNQNFKLPFEIEHKTSNTASQMKIQICANPKTFLYLTVARNNEIDWIQEPLINSEGQLTLSPEASEDQHQTDIKDILENASIVTRAFDYERIEMLTTTVRNEDLMERMINFTMSFNEHADENGDQFDMNLANLILSRMSKSSVTLKQRQEFLSLWNTPTFPRMTSCHVIREFGSIAEPHEMGSCPSDLDGFTQKFVKDSNREYFYDTVVSKKGNKANGDMVCGTAYIESERLFCAIFQSNDEEDVNDVVMAE